MMKVKHLTRMDGRKELKPTAEEFNLNGIQFFLKDEFDSVQYWDIHYYFGEQGLYVINQCKNECFEYTDEDVTGLLNGKHVKYKLTRFGMEEVPLDAFRTELHATGDVYWMNLGKKDYYLVKLLSAEDDELFLTLIVKQTDTVDLNIMLTSSTTSPFGETEEATLTKIDEFPECFEIGMNYTRAVQEFMQKYLM
jgi:hypothetical protein